MNNRNDQIPTVHFEGFDAAQNVFLYGNAKTSNKQSALFFPLEEYYPDSESGREIPYDRIVRTFQDYDVYLANLPDGETPDEASAASTAYRELNKEIRTSYYFDTVRTLLSDLLDGTYPDAVFDTHSPDPSDEENWADYKSAYFDATGLLGIAEQIDMPRMAANGGFLKFKAEATTDQQLTMDRFAAPDRFDDQGRYIEAA